MDICQICKSKENTEIIIKCSNNSCNVAVHKKCYGIKDILTNWKCAICKEFGKYKHQTCILCSYSNGPMKAFAKGGWCHIICALYLENVYFLKPEYLEKIYVINKESDKKCQLCEKKFKDNHKSRGYKIKCHHNLCENYLHVYCASEKGYLNYEKVVCINKNNNAGKFVNYTVYCDIHRKNSSKCFEPPPCLNTLIYKIPYEKLTDDKLKKQYKLIESSYFKKPVYSTSSSLMSLPINTSEDIKNNNKSDGKDGSKSEPSISKSYKPKFKLPLAKPDDEAIDLVKRAKISDSVRKTEVSESFSISVATTSNHDTSSSTALTVVSSYFLPAHQSTPATTIPSSTSSSKSIFQIYSTSSSHDQSLSSSSNISKRKFSDPEVSDKTQTQDGIFELVGNAEAMPEDALSSYFAKFKKFKNGPATTLPELCSLPSLPQPATTTAHNAEKANSLLEIQEEMATLEQDKFMEDSPKQNILSTIEKDSLNSLLSTKLADQIDLSVIDTSNLDPGTVNEASLDLKEDESSVLTIPTIELPTISTENCGISCTSSVKTSSIGINLNLNVTSQGSDIKCLYEPVDRDHCISLPKESKGLEHFKTKSVKLNRSCSKSISLVVATIPQANDPLRETRNIESFNVSNFKTVYAVTSSNMESVNNVVVRPKSATCAMISRYSARQYDFPTSHKHTKQPQRMSEHLEGNVAIKINEDAAGEPFNNNLVTQVYNNYNSSSQNDGRGENELDRHIEATIDSVAAGRNKRQSDPPYGTTIIAPIRTGSQTQYNLDDVGEFEDKKTSYPQHYHHHSVEADYSRDPYAMQLPTEGNIPAILADASSFMLSGLANGISPFHPAMNALAVLFGGGGGSGGNTGITPGTNSPPYLYPPPVDPYLLSTWMAATALNTTLPSPYPYPYLPHQQQQPPDLSALGMGGHHLMAPSTLFNSQTFYHHDPTSYPIFRNYPFFHPALPPFPMFPPQQSFPPPQQISNNLTVNTEISSFAISTISRCTISSSTVTSISIGKFDNLGRINMGSAPQRQRHFSSEMSSSIASTTMNPLQLIQSIESSTATAASSFSSSSLIKKLNVVSKATPLLEDFDHSKNYLSVVQKLNNNNSNNINNNVTASPTKSINLGLISPRRALTQHKSGGDSIEYATNKSCNKPPPFSTHHNQYTKNLPQLFDNDPKKQPQLHQYPAPKSHSPRHKRDAPKSYKMSNLKERVDVQHYKQHYHPPYLPQLSTFIQEELAKCVSADEKPHLHPSNTKQRLEEVPTKVQPGFTVPPFGCANLGPNDAVSVAANNFMSIHNMFQEIWSRNLHDQDFQHTTKPQGSHDVIPDIKDYDYEVGGKDRTSTGHGYVRSNVPMTGESDSSTMSIDEPVDFKNSVSAIISSTTKSSSSSTEKSSKIPDSSSNVMVNSHVSDINQNFSNQLKTFNKSILSSNLIPKTSEASYTSRAGGLNKLCSETNKGLSNNYGNVARRNIVHSEYGGSGKEIDFPDNENMGETCTITDHSMSTFQQSPFLMNRKPNNGPTTETWENVIQAHVDSFMKITPGEKPSFDLNTFLQSLSAQVEENKTNEVKLNKLRYKATQLAVENNQLIENLKQILLGYNGSASSNFGGIATTTTSLTSTNPATPLNPSHHFTPPPSSSTSSGMMNRNIYSPIAGPVYSAAAAAAQLNFYNLFGFSPIHGINANQSSFLGGANTSSITPQSSSFNKTLMFGSENTLSASAMGNQSIKYLTSSNTATSQSFVSSLTS